MASSSFLGYSNPGSYWNPGDLTSKGGIKSGTSFLFGQNQGLLNSANQQRAQESGSTLPGYQSLIDSGGYSPTEKANIEQSTYGGIQSGYNSAADAASRRMARTGNSAGYGSFMGSLARNKARDLGQAGLQVQSDFANQAYQRKLQGLQGLAQMYGVDTSFLNALNGAQSSLLGVGNSVQSRSRGVLGTIGSVLSLPGKLFGL